MLAWAMLGLGVAILAGAGLRSLAGGFAATLAFWAALVAVTVLAFRRGKPRGLLAFRPVDLLYAFALGIILRLVQGWLALAFGGGAALPSYATLDGSLPAQWWLDDLLAGGVIAPVIEEFFFRGVLLVTLLSIVRRFARGSSSRDADAGVGVGAFVAVLATTGMFVLTHHLVAPVSADSAVSIALLGAAAGSLVVFTGRIWPAVLLHMVFNLTGVALVVAGTLLG